MIDKTRNQRQQALKAKRKAEGLVRLELWVKPEHKEQIKVCANKLAHPDAEAPYQDEMKQRLAKDLAFPLFDSFITGTGVEPKPVAANIGTKIEEENQLHGAAIRDI